MRPLMKRENTQNQEDPLNSSRNHSSCLSEFPFTLNSSTGIHKRTLCMSIHNMLHTGMRDTLVSVLRRAVNASPVDLLTLAGSVATSHFGPTGAQHVSAVAIRLHPHLDAFCDGVLHAVVLQNVLGASGVEACCAGVATQVMIELPHAALLFTPGHRGL